MILDLGTCALGRAIDARGVPLDGGPPLQGRRVEICLRAPSPNERAPIRTPFCSGIRVVDGLLTIGRGARVGIFGSAGSGKSLFVEDVVAGCGADAVVLALVGERGREAACWIESRDERTTIVCATGDRGAHERIAAAHLALAHAAALRERGLHVLVVIDSLARIAGALREVAVANRETTGRGGFPPSVFAHLARLLEVGGEMKAGSMTLIATVLTDGDDRDPISEAARSLLDGHLTLSSRLAHAGRFPAVDVLRSTSRTMDAVVDSSHINAARRVRRAIALLEQLEDARSLGIETVDRAAMSAVAAEPCIEAFLRQARVAAPYDATLASLQRIADSLADDRADR